MITAEDLAAPTARVQRLSPSPVRAIFDRANELERAGRQVFHLELGRPDMDTPAHIKAAAVRAITEGHVHYGPSNGLSQLRAVIGADLGTDGTAADPDGVIVTVGTAEAIFLATTAFLEPGDEVVIPAPAWPNYERYVQLAGAKPVTLPTSADQDYQIDGLELRRRLSPRTRMLILCSPHNPTGSVLGMDSLQEIARVLDGSRVLVLADEIYKRLTYPGTTFVSPAQAADHMRDRTIIVGGFAKAYAMDGWRIGYLAAAPRLSQAALRIKQLSTVCNPTFLQFGALAALTGPQQPGAEMLREFQRRRDHLMRMLAEEPVATARMPMSTFYLYLAYSRRLPEASILASRLLEQEGVAVVPGSLFGAGQDHHLRISFSRSLAEVAEGFHRTLNLLARLAAEGSPSSRSLDAH